MTHEALHDVESRKQTSSGRWGRLDGEQDHSADDVDRGVSDHDVDGVLESSSEVSFGQSNEVEVSSGKMDLPS